MEKKLSDGKVAVIEAKLGKNSGISTIIDKANKQLISSSDKEHDFKMILFIGSEINSKTKADQFKDTIYGSTLIMKLDRSTKICYFFTYADFFKRQSLDAAIVGYFFNNKFYVEICLNHYSIKYKGLKESGFLEPFKKAVIDPLELEKEGLAYIPDDNIERKLTKEQKMFPSSNPMIKHLKNKYDENIFCYLDLNSPEFSIIN